MGYLGDGGRRQQSVPWVSTEVTQHVGHEMNRTTGPRRVVKRKGICTTTTTTTTTLLVVLVAVVVVVGGGGGRRRRLHTTT